MLELEIPIKAISGNHRNLMKNGRYFPSKEYKEFRQTVEQYIRVYLPRKKPETGNLSVEFTFGFKDNRRRDISNCVKTIEDACNGLLWKGDSQITEMWASKVHAEEDFIKIKIL